MDDLQLVFLALFTSILFFFILNSNRSPSSSPPSPWKLPSIGNSHNLITLLPPHRRLTYLARKYAPDGVLGLQVGQLPVVIISSPAAAKQVLTGTGFLDRIETLAIKIFSYNHTNLVFSRHNPHWSKARRICDAELLRPDRVKTFRKIRETESARFVGSIMESAGEILDMSEKIFSQLISITLAAAFGVGEEGKEILGEFVNLIQIASSMSGGLDVCDLFPAWPFSWNRGKAQRAHQRIDEILDEIIGGRKIMEDDGDGECLSLIDVLLRGKSNFSLTAEQIKPVILDVFMAGTETSATTIEWAMAELIRNPEIMQRVQSEVRGVIGNRTNVEEEDIDNLPFLDSIVKESLRLHPPTPLIPRQASKDTEIFGRYQIPCKTRVLVNIWAIGRDPQYWKDPEKFNPDRFGGGDGGIEVDYKGKSNNEHSFIPFGGGVRVCPGIWFGKANVMLTLAHLLFHFDWKLAKGRKPQDLDMDEGNGAIGVRKNHLHLVATKYRE